MKKNNWLFVIGALLIGILIGFMIGEEYERKKLVEIHLKQVEKETKEGLKIIDSLSNLPLKR